MGQTTVEPPGLSERPQYEMDDKELTPVKSLGLNRVSMKALLGHERRSLYSVEVLHQYLVDAIDHLFKLEIKIQFILHYFTFYLTSFNKAEESLKLH